MKRAAILVLLVALVALAIWLLRRDLRTPPAQVDHRRPSHISRSSSAPRPLPPSDAPAPPITAPRVTGRVINPDGQGVAGALVTLVAGLPLPAPGPMSTTTAADGHFAFDAVERRAYTVAALAGDLVAGPIPTVGTNPQPLLLRLAEGAYVTVTVVDSADQPIAAAQVFGPRPTVVLSGSDGKAILGPLQVGKQTFNVQASGYAPASTWIRNNAPAIRSEVTVVLRRGVPVSGRVLDEHRAPVAGAWVDATSHWGMTTTTVVSDTHGDFVIEALAPGPYDFSAHDDVHARVRGVDVTVADTPVSGVELVLKEGGVIAGVVLDATGRRVPFANIAWWGNRAVADQRGEFVLRGVDRQSVSISATGADVSSKVIWVDLTSTPRADVELVLELDGSIAGTVVDERGKGLPGVFVTAFPEYAHIPPRFDQPVMPREAITDGDGKFLFSGMSELLYRLDANRRPAAQWMQSSPSSAVGNVGDHDVVLELATEGRLTGRVVVAGSDAPPRGVVVRVAMQDIPAQRDGIFLAKELPPGTYDVAFDDIDCAPIVRQAVEIRSGVTTDLGTLTMTRSRMLLGRAVDAAGAPVADAQIDVGVIRPFVVEDDGVLRGGFHRYRSTVTANDGTFRITHFTPRPMVAYASHPAHGTSPGIDIPGDPSDPATPIDPPPITLVLPR